ncbi:hypothetical protein WDU94_015513 [Cyamophila willieti]
MRRIKFLEFKMELADALILGPGQELGFENGGSSDEGIGPDQVFGDGRRVPIPPPEMGSTSLGTLFDAPIEIPVLEKIKEVIAGSLPDGWREWSVRDSISELVVRENLRNKIRFAIPTVEMYTAIQGKDTLISEKTYRKVCGFLLNWPMGRALIFAPKEIVQALRSEDEEEIFRRGIAALRPRVLSRVDANKILDEESDIESPPYEPHPSPPPKLFPKQSKSALILPQILLAQRKAFGEAQAAFERNFPAVKGGSSSAFVDFFSGEDCEFSRVTDDLLQIVCGKRAELLAERRKLVDPADALSPARKQHKSGKASGRQKKGLSGVRPFRQEESAPLAPFEGMEGERIGGRLLHFVESWEALGAPPYISSILRGYRIPFIRHPPLQSLSPLSSLPLVTPPSENMDSVVSDLISQNIVSRSYAPTGYTSRVFLVRKGDGSFRPVFNLKRLNAFLSPKKFRLVSHLKVPAFLQRGDYLATIDLSQAYCHLPICPSHRRFLTFVYRDTLFHWNCLPFGLSTAPQTFALLSNWMASTLREKGIRTLVYLDDFLLAHQNPLVLQEQIAFTLHLLKSLGWIVNRAKSQLSPVQCTDFLGVSWDTGTGRIALPEKKILAIQDLLRKTLLHQYWSLKSAQVVAGVLNFAAFAVPLGRLHLRPIQLALRKLPRRFPRTESTIPVEVIEAFQWWISNVRKSVSLHPPIPRVLLSTDASDSGWGAVLSARFLQFSVGGSENLAHQSERAVCGPIGYLKESFSIAKPLCCAPIRQQNGNIVYPERRGSQIPSTSVGNGEAPFSHVQVEHSYSSVFHSGFIQLPSGQSFPPVPAAGLAPEAVSLLNDLPQMGIAGDRSLCVEEVTGCEEVRVSGPVRQSSRVCRRIFESLEVSPSLDLPSSSLNPGCSSSLEQCVRTISGCSAPLDKSILERGPESSSACSSPGLQRSAVPLGRSDLRPPSCSNQGHDIGDPGHTGWSAQVEDWSDREKNLLVAAWRPSTRASYRKPWARWVAWAQKSGVDPSSPSPNHLARFLAYLFFEEKLALASILLHKSVVATMSNPDHSAELTSHPVVSKMLKGISASSSSRGSRSIWNVSDLRTWMEGNLPLESSFFEVARYLSLFLLLSSGRRVHDLTLLHVDALHLQRSDESITFWPAFGSKTDSASFRQSGWQFSVSPSGEEWDLSKWLDIYLELRSRRCGSFVCSTLFITSVGPVRPASRAVIAGWVKTALKCANIPFPAGSIRSAVNSSLAHDNFALDIIMQRANWRSSDTFLRHYYREVAPSRSSDSSHLSLFRPGIIMYLFL